MHRCRTLESSCNKAHIYKIVLYFIYYNVIVVKMIPQLVILEGSPWAVLPPGIHQADLDEIKATFATNTWRRDLFNGFVEAAGRLRSAGCSIIYLDGSYVTGKPRPRDFDVCWDPIGVDHRKLDPIFLDFNNTRVAQKAAFKGEFFPSSTMCVNVSQTFLEFLQLDRFTGKKKGLVSVSLSIDPVLLRKGQP